MTSLLRTKHPITSIVMVLIATVSITLILAQKGCDAYAGNSITIAARGLYNSQMDFAYGVNSSIYDAQKHTLTVGNRQINTVDLGLCLYSTHDFKFNDVDAKTEWIVTPQRMVCFSSKYLPDSYSVVAKSGGWP